MTQDELLALIDRAAAKGWRKLDLSRQGLTKLPVEIGKLTNLTQLDLTDNQITEIPEAIAKLTNLTQLYLRSNKITEIPEAIANLTNLTQLYLRSNKITEIPKALANLTNLTQLYLSHNQITEIPEALANLTNLTQLHLSGNQITEIPEALANLTNLTRFDLSNNQITEIPEALANLTNLTWFNLSKNQKGDPESDRFTLNIYNQNQQGEYKPMTQNTNNFQNPNIANFANEVKDNARQQASNFNQTSGASVAELMQLIGNLRQTAAQFPPETRDDITIDLDDIEEEIKKPEKERNLPKLKKRLLATIAAGTLVAAPIAGMTDFTNNVLEIANKVGIELKLPSVK